MDASCSVVAANAMVDPRSVAATRIFEAKAVGFINSVKGAVHLGLCLLVFPPGEEALRAAFASLDADGNGRLDAVEIQQALSKLGMAAMPSEAFAVLQ
eukprot:jgi/Chrpa1/17373/Chrysochromulina_OHIO_Genome00023226-RA